MANSPSGESVLSRLDRVLYTVSSTESALSAAGIARRAGLPPATAHRVCRDLTNIGWLEVQPDGYVIGTRLWEMANRSSREMKLAVLARPFLSDVHAVMGKHIQLGVLEGHEVLFVDRLSARGAPAIHGGVAGRLPLHLSATGIVLLAHASSDFQALHRAYLEKDLDASAEIASASRLEQMRKQGYSVQVGAIEPDVTGVAVPIRRADGSVIAALGLVTDDGDVVRRPAPWVQMLQIAARGIQRAITGET